MSTRQGSARHIAFLRAVNVGAHNRISMARLRELLEGLGYGEVRTHLQSGNALLSAPGKQPQQLQEEIERALASELGVAVRTLVRSREELASAVAENPLQDIASDPAKLLVTFLSASPDRRLIGELAPADFEPDVFAVGKREIYVWYPEGVHATKLSNAFWEKQLGVVATGRNWKTVTRLLEMAAE
jgi:uncharacterized protein (DUF1697 family)